MSFSSDYPPGYQPSEDKASKNLLGSATSTYTQTATCINGYINEDTRTANKLQQHGSN